MTRQTIKKATVAALLSSFLILAAPAMGTDKEVSSFPGVEEAVRFNLPSVLARLEALAEAISFRLTSKKHGERDPNGEVSSEKVTAYQRSCTQMDTSGCSE